MLRYELAIRKAAMGLIKDEGLTLVKAIEKAKKDEELRALYFTAYVTLKKKRAWDDDSSSGKGAAARIRAEKKAKEEAEATRKKANGKGNGNKGKGKVGKAGKNKSMTKGGLTVMGMTPDNRYICFKFNDHRGCDGACGMVHCCRAKACYDTAHPMYLHPGFDQSFFAEQ